MRAADHSAVRGESLNEENVEKIFLCEYIVVGLSPCLWCEYVWI